MVVAVPESFLVVGARGERAKGGLGLKLWGPSPPVPVPIPTGSPDQSGGNQLSIPESGKGC